MEKLMTNQRNKKEVVRGERTLSDHMFVPYVKRIEDKDW
jgi:hypothetical protein